MGGSGAGGRAGGAGAGGRSPGQNTRGGERPASGAVAEPDGGAVPDPATAKSGGAEVSGLRGNGDESGAIARDAAERLPVFFEVRTLAFGAVIASMLAYLAAQFCDVFLFHFWKRVTRGRHLWLRNNGSTLVSQLVDTVAVITITYFIGGLAGVIDDTRSIAPQLVLLIATGYVFKMIFAMLDTIPFYLGVRWLSRYLEIDPLSEHNADREEAAL